MNLSTPLHLVGPGEGPPVNPIKVLRTGLKLTQDQLAKRSSTSRMHVIRAEQGCYPDPPPALEKFLLSEVDYDRPVLIAEYHNFQRHTRRSNYGKLNDRINFDYCPVGKHPFIYWREWSGLNQTEVAKYYCMHPAILYKFEKMPHLLNNLPDQLIEALLEAGYAPSLLDRLSLAYVNYKDYVRSQLKVTVHATDEHPTLPAELC